MAAGQSSDVADGKFTSLTQRWGIPKGLFFGYVGVLLFMVGDGVESAFISPYMAEHGAGSVTSAGWVITVYGIAVMLASWLSGALSEAWGPRKVMTLGLYIWIVFDVLYLVFALGMQNYPMMLLFYGIRGFGYPMFAFGFLVWITATAKPARLGTAVGWFYFAFTGGLPTLGALWSSLVIPALGEYGTLWSALVIIVIGGLCALYAVRERTGYAGLAPSGQRTGQTLLSSVSVLWTHPRLLVGTVVRIINTAPEFGMLAIMPAIFAQNFGFGQGRWLLLVSITYASNIVFNLIFGALSDRLGWRLTIGTFGAIGCAITVTAFYFVPYWLGADYYWAAVLVGILYGATLAGFVPISALIPSMVPENKGGAMAMLNLGAGGATFVGPAIASLFFGLVGAAGVTLIFAGLYVVAALLTVTLKLPSNTPKTTERAEPAPAGV